MDFDVVGKMTVNDDGGLENASKGVKMLQSAFGDLGPIIEMVGGVLESVAPELIVIGLAIETVKHYAEELTKTWEAVKETLAEGAELEQLNTRLEALRQNTQKLDGVSADMADSLARKYTDLSGVDDELEKSAEGVLYTYDAITKQTFPQAMEAANDLAAALGISLTTAADDVGRVMEDPISAMARLKRAGIELSPVEQASIKDMEQHGRTAAAAARLLFDLNEKTQGLAGTMGGTFQGTINKVNNLFEDLRKELGASFMPVLQALAQDFYELAKPIAEALGPVIKQLQADFKELGAQLNTPAMRQSLQQLGKDAGEVLGKVLPMALKLAMQFVKDMAQVWEEHGPEIVDSIDSIAYSMSSMIDMIKSVIDTANELQQTMQPWIDLGTDIVQGIIGGITGNPDMIGNALKKIVDLAIADIKQQLGIASASKAMKEQVGQWIPAGMAEGITDKTGLVRDAMSHLNTTVMATVNNQFNQQGAAPVVAGGGGVNLYNPIFQVANADEMDNILARFRVAKAGL